MQCSNCNALLASDSGFCLVCKQPVLDFEEAHASDGPRIGPMTKYEASEAATLEALRTVPVRPALPPKKSEREELPPAEFSRWKQGPTSFNPWVKVTLTIVILAFAPVGGFWGFTVLFGIVYFPVAGLLLWGLWRKQRVG